MIDIHWYSDIKKTNKTGYIPPLIVFVGEESIDETNCPHYSSKQQHLRVETQPRKINTYLLSIILPVEGKTKCCKISLWPCSFGVNTHQIGLLCAEVVPYKINGLLLEETQESGPVFVEIVSFTFTVRVPRSCPVSTLHTHRGIHLHYHIQLNRNYP